MKGRSERVLIVNLLAYEWLSIACTFMCIWGLNSEVSIHMKGRSERVLIVNLLAYEWLSIACTFMCIWGLNAVQHYLLVL